jgi:hypothetical protein
MIILFLTIKTVALKVIRGKSIAQVDAYAFWWHQIFQFANLYIILIGGSIFNQLQSLVEDPYSVGETIAKAVPGSCVYFVDMIIIGSFGMLGLELSLVLFYSKALILQLIHPTSIQTQRALDKAHTPRSIVWGRRIPPMVFVFFVAILYMPVVPVMEIFALVYFFGFYVVFKHQCLHVYSTKFEGGGLATWQTLFYFLIGALYMSEFVFIAYMSLMVCSQ